MAAHCSSAVLWITESHVYPALLTMMSSAPYSSRAAETRSSPTPTSVTLPGTARALPPADVMSSTVFFAGPASRSLTITCDPSDASFVAIAWPIPRPAPVTMLTLPSNRAMTELLSLDIALGRGRLRGRLSGTYYDQLIWSIDHSGA